jgi:hypothetical protein
LVSKNRAFISEIRDLGGAIAEAPNEARGDFRCRLP